MCAVDTSDEAAVCVDEMIFAFYEFHNASSRVAANKGDEVVDVSYALCLVCASCLTDPRTRLARDAVRVERHHWEVDERLDDVWQLCISDR